MLVGGDVALAALAPRLAADPAFDPLGNLDRIVSDVDLRLVSVVSPISGKPGIKWAHGVPVAAPATADALARARIDLALLATPTLGSSGKGPLLDTFAELERAGVGVAGAAADPAAVGRPARLRALGWSVGIVAVTDWPAPAEAFPEGKAHVALADPESVAASVRELRRERDLVLVSHHGGPALAEEPTAAQRALARAAVEAGADAVFRHGARVPQGIELISGRPVFHGLGTLVGGPDPRNPWAELGFLARVRFAPGVPPRVEACPYHIARGAPELLSGARRPTDEGVFRRTITRLSAPLGPLRVSEPDAHSCFAIGAPTPASADAGTAR